jgi:sulfur carrier protein ThiS
MKVLFLSNDAGGFAEYKEIQPGTTVDAFLRAQGYDPANYNVRVNREEVSADAILADGARCSLTPLKINGATM